MALSISTPATIVAAENPIIYSISTGTVGAEAFSKTRFTVSNFPDNNFEINFNLSSPQVYTKTFYAKDFPNNDSYFLTQYLKDRSGNTLRTNTTSQVAESLAECFQKDIFLSKYYFITYTGGTRVELIAKVAASIYDIPNSDITVTNGAQIGDSFITSGSSVYEGASVENYNVFIEPFISQTKQYGESVALTDCKRITELVLPFQTDNDHKFNLSDIFKSFVNTPRPSFNSSSYDIVTDYIKPFRVRYGTLAPLVPNENTAKKTTVGTTSTVWAVNAATDLENANTFTSLTGATGSIPIISTAPSVKRSRRDQKELLCFLAPKGFGSVLTVRSDLTFWNGATSANTELVTYTGTSDGGLVVVNAGFEDLGLDELETSTKKVKTSSVKVYVDNDTITNHYPDIDDADLTTGFDGWWQNESGTVWYNEDNVAKVDFGYFSTIQNLPAFTTWTGNNWTIASTPSATVPASTNYPIERVNLTGFTIGNYSFDYSFTWTGSGIAVHNLNFYKNGSLVGTASTGNLNGAGTYTGTFNISLTDVPDKVRVTATNFTASPKSVTINYISGDTTQQGIFSSARLRNDDVDYTNDVYDIDYSITFQTGSSNTFKVQFFNLTGGTASPLMTIGTFGAGTHTGTYVFTGSSAYTSEGFYVTGQSGMTQTARINSLELRYHSVPTQLTAARSFRYELTEPSSSFGVMLLSRLGVFETFNFIGLREEQYDRKAQELTVPLTYNNDGSVDEGFKYVASYGVELTKKAVVNSGWIDENTFDWLTELLSSNEIYSTDSPIKYLRLDGFKYVKSSQSDEYNIEVSFIESMPTNNVSI
jgi:hypothetical protein